MHDFKRLPCASINGVSLRFNETEIRRRFIQVGFTLLELIVVILIIGILAAVALPQFFNTGQSTRISIIASLAGTLSDAATNARLLCAVKSSGGCDVSNPVQYTTLNGHAYWFNFGFPNAGVDIGNTGIDMWIAASGFTPSLVPANYSTYFALNNAPNPSQCGVNYQIAWTASAGPTVTQYTSGC